MAVEFVSLGPGDYDRAKRVLNRARHPGFVGREFYYRCATTGMAVVAVDGGVDLGVALVEKGKLGALSVIPEARGRGVASALVAHTQPKFVSSIEDRVGMFERLGYRRVGAAAPGRNGKLAVQLMELAGEIQATSDVRAPPTIAEKPVRIEVPLPEVDDVDVGALVTELATRGYGDQASEALTIEQLTNGHAKQAAALRDLLEHANRRHSWLTSRRSGKTTAAAFALLLWALVAPRRNCLYIGLTRLHAWDVILREIMLPLLEKHAIAHSLNKVRQQVTFPNGSVISFGGSDDVKHIQTILGNRLALAVIDEQQSQPPVVLRALVTKILPPALSDSGDGRMLLCGTWPDVEAGFALETFRGGRYVTHSWAMSDNPHLHNPAAEQENYLAETGRTREDPEYLRDWLGLPVWSNVATAYRYDVVRNGWTGVPALWAVSELPPGKLVAVTPPEGVDTFAVGIDPAYSSDRYCAVLWGWSSRAPVGLWQCAEWVTAKAAYTVKSQWLAVIKAFVTHYRTVISVTSDSQSTADDVALIEHGLVIEPAVKGKGSVKQRVDRMGDLLATGRAHVLIGSALEHDLKLAKFDAEARAEGRYEWDDTVIHPDVADAATYALPAYIEAAAKVKRTAEEIEAAEWREAWTPKTEYGYGSHDDGSGYGGPRD